MFTYERICKCFSFEAYYHQEALLTACTNLAVMATYCTCVRRVICLFCQSSVYSYIPFFSFCADIYFSCGESFLWGRLLSWRRQPTDGGGELGRVFTGSDTKLVDTHTWYSRYDENLDADRRSRAQTHTWPRAFLQPLTISVQIIYVVRFTPRFIKTGYDFKWVCVIVIHVSCPSV